MADPFVAPLPATGEQPMTTAPTWGGAGGGTQAQNVYAWKKFNELFGRNPTASELAMLAPAYNSGDPNVAGVSQGDSVVAQYFSAMNNTPANQAAQTQKANEAKAPQYYDQINQMFQNTLGRDATDAEKLHFGAQMASGNADAYTVGQFLTALPEAVKKQDTAFRNDLNNTLQSQDVNYYQNQILPAIRQSYTQAGRSLDSSGYASALAKAAQQQNTQRESFLNNLTASQYQNSQDLAQQAYNNAYGNYQNLGNYSLQSQQGAQNAALARSQQLQDYAIQKQAYDQYLQRYGKSKTGVSGGVTGALGGAMLGAKFGPWGALAGGLGGGLLGAYA